MAGRTKARVKAQAPNERANPLRTQDFNREAKQGISIMLRTSMTKLSRTLTASVLTLAIAFSGLSATATPASANGHRTSQGAQVAAVLGGLLLLYGVSQAGRNNGNRRNDPAIQQPQVRPQHPPRPRYNTRVAPAQCFVQGGQGNRRYRGYDYNCMLDSVRNARALPQNCLRNVWTNRGQRTIYGGRCLANNGWSRG